MYLEFGNFQNKAILNKNACIFPVEQWDLYVEGAC